MSENKYLILFCSCPDVETAGRLADALVQERLAACVTRLPGATSVYHWEGAVHRDPEVLLIIKTTAGRAANLTARIEALHPYEVPEVLAVPVDGGAERYLAWLGQTVS
jgi:periplasmic divalent cation tolerance protein